MAAARATGRADRGLSEGKRQCAFRSDNRPGERHGPDHFMQTLGGGRGVAPDALSRASNSIPYTARQRLMDRSAEIEIE